MVEVIGTGRFDVDKPGGMGGPEAFFDVVDVGGIDMGGVDDGRVDVGRVNVGRVDMG